ISPEIQTFVSTTTRSAGFPDLADRLHHVPFHFLLGEVVLLGDAIPAPQQRVEAALPLVTRDLAGALRAQPGVHGLADERCDGLDSFLRERPNADALADQVQWLGSNVQGNRA